MQISESTFYLIKIFATIFVAMGVLVIGYLFLSREPIDTELFETRILFTQLQTVAEVHRGRMFDYNNVCREILPPEGVVCNEDADSYAIEKKLVNGKYYCVDSTGYKGTRLFSKGSLTRCSN